MPLAEILDDAVNSAKRFKERVTKKGPGDIPHLVDVYRGKDIVATLFVRSRIGGQYLVRMIQLAAAGFDADAMAFVMESLAVGPKSPFDLGSNPVTGAPLGPHDLSDLGQTGIDQALVTETLYACAQNRAGDIVARNLPYHYVGNRYLVWDEEDDLAAPAEGDVRATGAMADPINEAMNNGITFSQAFPGIAVDELSRAEMDIAVANVIGRLGNAMPSRGEVEVALWAEKGGSRLRVIQERTGRP